MSVSQSVYVLDLVQEDLPKLLAYVLSSALSVSVLAYTVEGVRYIRKLYGFFKKNVYTVYTVALMLAGVHLKYSAEIKHMWYLLSSALSVSESIL